MTDDTQGVATKPRRRRVAVVGGGPAALAAVHELTRDPHWEDWYDITVYQMGWRLGGKCASGRGPVSRIEEHGLHIFQGWYDNAFQLVRQVYEAREVMGLDPQSPFQKWQDAFVRENAMILVEYRRAVAEMHHWAVVFPENERLPGEHVPSFWTLMGNALAVALSATAGALLGGASTPLKSLLLDLVRLVDHGVQVVMDALPRMPTSIVALLRALGEMITGHEALVELLLSMLRAALHLCEALTTLVDWENGRCALALLELAVVTMLGVVEDTWRADARAFDFARIDDQDFRRWLSSHGASKLAVESGLVRFVYDATFSNLAGQDGAGAFAAGQAVHAMIQMLSYRGSMVWMPASSIGEVVVAPTFQVLRAKGVRFEFFHRLEAVHWSDTGRIEALTMGVQARLAPGVAAYDPLEPVAFGDKVLQAWPSHPRYAQLDPVQAAELEARHIDLECPWADWKPELKPMRRGADFDDVILAVPVAALRDVCAELVARMPQWRGLVDNVTTTPTSAMQLWLTPSLLELGMNARRWGLPRTHSAANCEVCVSPFSSWTDCSATLRWQHWPTDNTPLSLVFYCGACDSYAPPAPYSDHGYPARQLTRTRILAEQWLRDNMGYFWPKGTSLRSPRGLDFKHLTSYDPAAESPQARFETQYFRANVAPSERYTLCEPGSPSWRLRAGRSGFANLFLAGDWVRHRGVNAGFAESAVIAGRQAAQALMRANPEGPPTLALAPLLVPRDVAHDDDDNVTEGSAP